MLCNMDIQRFFHLAYQEPIQGSDGEILKIGFHYLVMDTVFQGEYGVVRCRCVAQIETPFELHFSFIETSGESESSLFTCRENCISFFNTHILPFFNPLIHLKDGPLSFSQEPESSQDS